MTTLMFMGSPIQDEASHEAPRVLREVTHPLRSIDPSGHPVFGIPYRIDDGMIGIPAAPQPNVGAAHLAGESLQTEHEIEHHLVAVDFVAARGPRPGARELFTLASLVPLRGMVDEHRNREAAR